MARATRDYAIAGAAVGGLLYLVTRIRIIGFAFWLLVMYLLFSVVYDTFISETVLPDGIKGVYEWRVTEVEYPDLSFSRESPEFTVHGVLTNNSSSTLQRWILQGKLYDCPGQLVSIDHCRYVSQWSTAIDAELAPHSTEPWKQVVNFWQGGDTHEYVRAVWTITRVTMDRDASK